METDKRLQSIEVRNLLGGAERGNASTALVGCWGLALSSEGLKSRQLFGFCSLRFGGLSKRRKFTGA